MILLSLLTDAYIQLYDYASDGAILIKSVEENEPELGVIPVTVTK